MYLFYSLLLTAGTVALLPLFLYKALRHGKYVAGIKERLGQLSFTNQEQRPVIWLHCVSVGETQAARPLAQALLEQFPSHALVVSTVTRTGQEVARKVFAGEAAAVFYLPFDWAWSVRRALRKVNPRYVLIMETELWPNFLRECRRRGVRIALVNGRLSERSFRGYKLIGRFSRRIVQCLDLALMQSEADAERIRALGLRAERVAVSGNLKFDADAAKDKQALGLELGTRFQLGSADHPLIVAASTHKPEEHIMIEALKRLRAISSAPAPRLLIAPRHPERFNETAALLDSSGLTWTRRTNPQHESDAVCDCILLDSIGELRAVYDQASIVFVGGSLARNGGHNVLEPAEVGACIVTGAHTANFKAIMDNFLERDALIQLPALSEAEAIVELARLFAELLSDEARRDSMGERARAVVESNRGATARTIKLLAPMLSPTPEEHELNQLDGARPPRSDALST
jgi:3-deoxy-D-manno-octulosonic-acid transferase